MSAYCCILQTLSYTWLASQQHVDQIEFEFLASGNYWMHARVLYVHVDDLSTTFSLYGTLHYFEHNQTPTMTLYARFIDSFDIQPLDSRLTILSFFTSLNFTFHVINFIQADFQFQPFTYRTHFYTRIKELTNSGF